MTEALSAPGGLAADIEGRLAVSDTGRHRIVVGHAVGNALDVRSVVGGGEPGLVDGNFDTARFHAPRGVALSGDMLIVADTGGHAVRMIDLASGGVATMAGTGESAGEAVDGGDPMETTLDSPWDVLLNEYDLYVALGPTGAVWRLDLKEGALVPFLDPTRGPDGGPRAVSLASDGTWLYVADAASATVRRARFEDARVETLVESGPEVAGIAWGQGNHRLWMADAATDSLRMLDPDSGALEPVEPFEADLDRPGGLASAGHLVYVADTGHDRVLRVDQIDKRVVELGVEGGSR